jgi:hypothetical protein
VTPGAKERTHEGKARLREAAITALLTTNSIQAAAKKAGVSRRTLLRWMKDPDFRKEYAEAKSDALKVASAILVRSSAKAALVLAEIFSNKRGRLNQASRVSAAIGCLRLAHESFELENFEERLSTLERQSGALY